MKNNLKINNTVAKNKKNKLKVNEIRTWISNDHMK